jgi:rubrerythrin
MDHTKLPDKQALSAAIEMEEKGYSFYKETAARAKDPLARQVFDFLAGEELHHIDAIKKFYDSYVSGKIQTPERPAATHDKVRSNVITNLFKSLTKDAPVAGGELDAYKFAIDFERKGEVFYKKVESEASNPDAKILYGFLIEEERRHFKIVESCLLYFENPAEFFHQREQWSIDGA